MKGQPISEETILRIRRQRLIDKTPMKIIAGNHGLGVNTISRIVNRRGKYAN